MSNEVLNKVLQVQALAFACGSHPRLGMTSPVHQLSGQMINDIIDKLLKTAQFLVCNHPQCGLNGTTTISIVSVYEKKVTCSEVSPNLKESLEKNFIPIGWYDELLIGYNKKESKYSFYDTKQDKILKELTNLNKPIDILNTKKYVFVMCTQLDTMDKRIIVFRKSDKRITMFGYNNKMKWDDIIKTNLDEPKEGDFTLMKQSIKDNFLHMRKSMKDLEKVELKNTNITKIGGTNMITYEQTICEPAITETPEVCEPKKIEQKNNCILVHQNDKQIQSLIINSNKKTDEVKHLIKTVSPNGDSMSGNIICGYREYRDSHENKVYLEFLTEDGKKVRINGKNITPLYCPYNKCETTIVGRIY